MGAAAAAVAGLLLLGVAPLPAQVVRPEPLRRHLAADPGRTVAVWIHVDSTRWAGGPRARLLPAARERRAVAGVGALPPERGAPEDLRRRLADAGARIREESRWLRAVSAEVDSAALEAVARIPGVRRIAPVGRSRRIPVPTPPEPFPGPAAVPDTAYGPLLDVVDRLRIPLVHELGYTGSGIRIGVLDTGFRTDHRAFAELELLATRDFIGDDSVVANEAGDPEDADDHGTAVWSLLGGRDPGRILGVAFDAAFALAKSEDVAAEPRADEDRWVAGLEWLESLGVRVVNSSLGYRDFDDFAYPYEALDGDSTASARAADEAARRGVLVVNAAGNGGPSDRSLLTPADADSAVAVGAVDAGSDVAGFSSRGPTADGRVKPDLVAPGVSVPAASALGTGTYASVSGTSFASPLVAGAVALLAQAYPTRGPEALAEALRLSGDARGEPTNDRGHGIPDVASALFFFDGLASEPLADVDGDGTLETLVPTFRWDAPTVHPSGRPVTFRVELARSRDFVDAVEVDSVVGAFARTPDEPLRPGDGLFWRVVARTVQGLERVAFPVRGPVRVPAWVTLDVLNEPRGVTISEPRPVFRWSAPEVPPPAGPLVFELVILSERGNGEAVRRHPDLAGTELRLPEPLPVNTPLRWRIIARAPGGRADTATSAGPFVVTSRSEPPVTLLHQNFPNPFPRPELGRSETRIWFDLARSGPVELAVYDLRGRLVRRLIPARGCPTQTLEAGLWGREGSPDPGPCVELSWDGRDLRGGQVDRGVYLLRLRAGGAEDVKRIVYWP